MDRMDRRRLLGAAGALAAGLAARAQAQPGAIMHWWHGKYPPAPTYRRAHGRPGFEPVVATTNGDVRGLSVDHVLAFKGVPYGDTTAGANRFRPPQKPKPWKETRDARDFGLICPQPIMNVIPEEFGSQAHGPQGEDCLVVDVWTPELGGELRPVMVWFHGGGYAVGGGSSAWYDGTNLAKKGVVVVAVTHRLNVFGFLDLSSFGGEAFARSGNAGMLDCVAALEWVRDNIKNFGGDPKSVTIFGESGGAGKVSTLMCMPAARGLFHKAIAQSGAALKHQTKEQSARSAKMLLDRLGIGPGETAKLQALPVDTIVKALGPGAMAFGPVVDGVAIPRNPFDPTATEISADVPFIMGTNLTEATFLPDTPLEPMDDAALLDHVKSYTKTDEAAAKALIATFQAEHPGRDNIFVFHLIASEYWMRSQVLVQAVRKAELKKAPAYVYQFNKLSPARGGKLHCPHGSEIPFVFNDLASAPELVGDAPEAQALAEKMSDVWIAFARTGRPDTPHLPRWPAYEPGARRVMIFDETCSVVSDPGGEGRVAIAKLKAS
jgi:para-nitrobenzyl esterase